MSVNPTAALCRAGAIGAATALVLALPTAALAHKKDPTPPAGWVQCGLVQKSKKKFVAVFCPPGQQTPAPEGDATNQSADVIVNLVNQPTAPVALGGDQAITNPAPTPAAAATPVSASSASTSCERRTRIRFVLHKGRVRSARVLLNGRAIAVSRGKKSTSVLVDVRGRKNTAFTVRHVVVLRNGRVKTGTRRFRTCG